MPYSLPSGHKDSLHVVGTRWRLFVDDGPQYQPVILLLQPPRLSKVTLPRFQPDVAACTRLFRRVMFIHGRLCGSRAIILRQVRASLHSTSSREALLETTGLLFAKDGKQHNLLLTAT